MSVPRDYLAAGLPPSRLLAGAARRAWRRAREREDVRAPTPDELVAGTGARSAEALALRLASPGRGLAAYDRRSVAASLPRLFPDEPARAVARAARVLAGELRIFGRPVEVARAGGGTDWQLDPLARLRFDAGARSAALPCPPGADPKHAWAVGRGEQWVALACAAIACPPRAGELASAFTSSLHDFVVENGVGRGVQWASPMEAALRLVCAGQAHALLAGERALADARYALDLAGLTVATARLLLARLEDAQLVPNNHLAADLVGLLAAAALLPEWWEASRWRAVGAAGLRRELALQTHPDGTSFEGSLPYHRLAVELFTAGALLARRARVALGAAYQARLHAMFGAARALLFAGGELPQLGDHDSGRVLAFRERDPLDARHLLPLGAAVTGDAALRVEAGAAGAEEALFTCGAAAVERLLTAPPGPPPRSASSPAAGFHLLRAGRAELALSCGRNGQRGVGGHSHNDKLAFELRLDGALVVCDPGSPSYTGDRRVRDAFRSTRAHATVVVDGAEQAPLPAGRAFALPDAARARRLELSSTADGERFVGEHRGYARLGVVHRREVRVAPDAVRIVDWLSGAGFHDVELRWPFPDEAARLRPLAPAERVRLAALRGIRAAAFDLERAVEVGPPEEPRALVVVAAPLAPRLERAGYSPGYAELRPARTAVWSGRVGCPATFSTVILPLRRAPGS